MLPQERKHEVIELTRALQARHVRGRLDALEARTGDLAREALRDRVHVGLVLLADEDERRRANLAELLREVVDEELLLVLLHSDRELVGPPLHLGDAGAHLRVDVLRPAARAYLAAKVQGRGEAMAAALLAAAVRTPAECRRLAGSIGLNLVDYDRVVKDEATDAELDAAIAWAQGAGPGLPLIWVQDGTFVKPIPVTASLTYGKVTEVSGADLSEKMQVVIGEQTAQASAGGTTTSGSNPFIPQFRRGGSGGSGGRGR